MEMDDHKRRRNMILYVLIAFALYLVLNQVLFPQLTTKQQITGVSFSTMLDDLDENKVEDMDYTAGQDTQALYTLKGDSEDVAYRATVMPGSEDYLAQKIDESDANVNVIIPSNDSGTWLYLLITFAPIIIFFLFGWWLNRRMKKAMGDDNPSMDFSGGFGGFGGGGLGKSGARIVASKDVGVTFKDVAGQEEAKESLKEVVDFLEKPERYEAIGAKLPRGVLLVGPPGTGKTLIAKAVAGEAGVPFFSISGSEFVEMFVGRGAAKVRDLFKQAKEKAPCIVFIDEIDTIGKKRDGAGIAGNDEREQTLNQLLAEMDGFDGSKGVVILAATNRPESLDPALLRPGRFDRRIPVELPDLAGREAILRVHAKDVKCSPSIDFNAIARASAGASGAELANMVNEAALLAVKDGRRSVVQKDLEEAIETVIAGYQKKGAVISNKEKLIVSYHEIGHALVAALTKGSAPVHKITIVPRTSGALGYTMQVEEGEQHLMSKDEAYSRIMTLTGGSCAEELIFDSITSGASNDIEQATKLARSMITRLGMSDTFGMTALETVNNQYLGGDTSLACSAETAAKVDEEVVKLIRKAHDEAKELLENNMGKLHELAKYLYDHETITGEEFMEILQKSE